MNNLVLKKIENTESVSSDYLNIYNYIMTFGDKKLSTPGYLGGKPIIPNSDNAIYLLKQKYYYQAVRGNFKCLLFIGHKIIEKNSFYRNIFFVDPMLNFWKIEGIPPIDEKHNIDTCIIDGEINIPNFNGSNIQITSPVTFYANDMLYGPINPEYKYVPSAGKYNFVIENSSSLCGQKTFDLWKYTTQRLSALDKIISSSDSPLFNYMYNNKKNNVFEIVINTPHILEDRIPDYGHILTPMYERYVNGEWDVCNNKKFIITKSINFIIVDNQFCIIKDNKYTIPPQKVIVHNYKPINKHIIRCDYIETNDETVIFNYKNITNDYVSSYADFISVQQKFDLNNYAKIMKTNDMDKILENKILGRKTMIEMILCKNPTSLIDEKLDLKTNNDKEIIFFLKKGGIAKNIIDKLGKRIFCPTVLITNHENNYSHYSMINDSIILHSRSYLKDNFTENKYDTIYDITMRVKTYNKKEVDELDKQKISKFEIQQVYQIFENKFWNVQIIDYVNGKTYDETRLKFMDFTQLLTKIIITPSTGISKNLIDIFELKINDDKDEYISLFNICRTLLKFLDIDLKQDKPIKTVEVKTVEKQKEEKPTKNILSLYIDKTSKSIYNLQNTLVIRTLKENIAEIFKNKKPGTQIQLHIDTPFTKFQELTFFKDLYDYITEIVSHNNSLNSQPDGWNIVESNGIKYYKRNKL